MERKTRFELATLALARRCSTPEPLPHVLLVNSRACFVAALSLMLIYISIIRISFASRASHSSRINVVINQHQSFEILIFELGRGGWIRTIESSANGFTVRPLWPLGNPSISCSLISASALLLFARSTLAYREYFSLLARSRASHPSKINFAIWTKYI